MGNLQRLSVTWETCCQKTRKVDFFSSSLLLVGNQMLLGVVVGGGVVGVGGRVETFPKNFAWLLSEEAAPGPRRVQLHFVLMKNNSINQRFPLIPAAGLLPSP